MTTRTTTTNDDDTRARRGVARLARHLDSRSTTGNNWQSIIDMAALDYYDAHAPPPYIRTVAAALADCRLYRCRCVPSPCP